MRVRVRVSATDRVRVHYMYIHRGVPRIRGLGLFVFSCSLDYLVLG